MNKQGLWLYPCRLEALLDRLLADFGKTKACTFTTADDRIIIFTMTMKYNRNTSGSLRATIGVGVLGSAMVVKF